MLFCLKESKSDSDAPWEGLVLRMASQSKPAGFGLAAAFQSTWKSLLETSGPDVGLI